MPFLDIIRLKWGNNRHKRSAFYGKRIHRKRIKEEREKCQFSQQELASVIGLKSHSTLVAIENGTQEVKALIAQICRTSKSFPRRTIYRRSGFISSIACFFGEK